ncbi:hypothetical protein [Amycolatopsis sp. cmx-4-61]
MRGFSLRFLGHATVRLELGGRVMWGHPAPASAGAPVSEVVS